MKKTIAAENIIYKEMQLKGCVNLSEAMNILNISEATARRLFTRMEMKGLGIRSHGKISLPDSSYSFYRYETSEELYVKEKKQIANLAVSLLKDGDTIFLDSGTTVCLFSMALNQAIKQNLLKNISVFTNSYMIINILNDSAIVNMTGGTYRPNRKDFCGYMAERCIKEYHFNKCILGTDGFSSLTGFTTTDFDCAKICETAISRSDQVVILMDSHKYNKAASISFSDGKNISAVITDCKISEKAVKELMRLGINVKIAEND